MLQDITDQMDTIPTPSSSSHQPTDQPTTSSPEETTEDPGVLRIVAGEIINPAATTSSPAESSSSTTVVDPNRINITFRLPNGKREHEVFDRTTTCSEVYTWLMRKEMFSHEVWTQFPKRLVPSDSSSLLGFVGGLRVMLIVEETDDE